MKNANTDTGQKSQQYNQNIVFDKDKNEIRIKFKDGHGGKD